MLWCRRTSSVPSQLMLWRHWSSSVFLDFETFLHTVEGDMICKVRVGKWLGEIKLGCSSLGRSQLLYAQAHLVLLPWLLHILFSSPQGPPGAFLCITGCSI